VVVVLPDLEAAAPLIDAVFGNAPKPLAIPYTITGRRASECNPCAQALLAVLAVAVSRFTATSVFELLQLPLVARRFGIADADLASIHRWIRDSGIRWGIDARHRGELGLPAIGEYSFSDGLDRLFLGYALPASVTEPVNGRLAAGAAEGSDALALGSFGVFARELERLRGDIAQPRSADEWRDTLHAVIDDFMAPQGEEIDDARQTLLGIEALHANMRGGSIARPLHIDVVRVALKAELDDPSRGGVPSGAVTFAAMSSLRNLPYRIVCMLGLDDGVFPSATTPAEFDLMPCAPRRGDRQRRADERNLFLDLVLAARDRVLVAYTGRSVRDNAPLPPSVVVAELIDYCAAAIDAAPGSPESLARARRRFAVEHPLQPFSPAYFEPDADPRRASFNDEYAAALSQRSGVPPPPAGASAQAPPVIEALGDDVDPDDIDVREPQQPFFAEPLPAAGPEYRELTLATLTRFFRNPCQHLLVERLGIRLADIHDELEDDEPFVADWSARDALAERVLPRMLAGESLPALLRSVGAGLDYPPGRLGAVERERELERLDGFARRLAPALAPPRLAPIGATLEFTLAGETWRLTGGFGDVAANGRVLYRYGDTQATDYLCGWIEHLFLNALNVAAIAARTAWHSRNGVYALRPVGDARARLAALLALYRDGLHAPLHFYARAAWAYATGGSSLTKAAAAWQSTRFYRYGEDRHPAYRLALRGTANPLDADFEQCATTVYAPLIAHIDDARLG
jgi:exodeoxyribonuclease V gamma subunit